MTVRVVIADDHPVFRAGMVSVLEDLPDVEVVGQAGDGEEAVAAASEHRPDVVLMDLRMPGVGGLEATARIRVEHPEVAVVVLTMDSDDDSIFAALRAGARGYLLKEAEVADIERAITGAARGEAVFGAGIATRVLAFFSASRQTSVEPVPAADTARARGARPDRPGSGQPRHREAAGALRQDRPQPGQ